MGLQDMKTYHTYKVTANIKLMGQINKGLLNNIIANTNHKLHHKTHNLLLVVFMYPDLYGYCKVRVRDSVASLMNHVCN